MAREIEHEIAALEEAITKLTRQYRAQLNQRQCCPVFRPAIPLSGFRVDRIQQVIGMK